MASAKRRLSPCTGPSLHVEVCEGEGDANGGEGVQTLVALLRDAGLEGAALDAARLALLGPQQKVCGVCSTMCSVWMRGAFTLQLSQRKIIRWMSLC